MSVEIEPRQGLSRARLLILVLILILGISLRLHELGKKSFWYDEGYYLIHAQEMVSISTLMDTNSTTDPPLFPLMVKAWVGALDRLWPMERTTELHDFLIRLLPCLIEIAIMPLLFGVSRSLLGNVDAALIATFLYAISPFHVYYAQELRSYTTCSLLSLIALYCAHHALIHNKARYWIGYAACLVLLLYTHFFSAWIIIAFNLYFLLTLKSNWKRVVPWVGYQAVAFVLSLPCIEMARVVAGYFQHVAHPWYDPTTIKTGLITFKNFFAGYTPNVAAYWALFGLAITCSLAGCWALRRRRQDLVLLLVMAFAPIAFNVLFWSHRPMSFYEHRHFIFCGIVAIMLVAAGIQSLPRKGLAAVVLLAFIAATVPCLRDVYAHRMHPIREHRIAMWDKVDLRSAGKYINEHMAEGDVVGHPGHFMWFPFLYYCKAEQHILAHTAVEQKAMIGNYGSREIAITNRLMPEILQDVAAHARRIWFIESHGLTHDDPHTSEIFRRWLEMHAVRQDYQVFQGVTIACYAFQPSRENIIRDQLADYGEAPLAHYRTVERTVSPLGTRADSPRHDPQDLFDATENVLTYPQLHCRSDFPIGPINPTRAGPIGKSDQHGDTWGARFCLGYVKDNLLQLEGAPQPLPVEVRPDSLLLKDTGQSMKLGESLDFAGASCSLLALDPARNRALVAAYPTRTTDKFSYRFQVVNPTGAPVTVHCSVLESAAVVESSEFLMQDARTSVWHPWNQYDPGPPEGEFFAPSIVAHLQHFHGDGETIHAPVTPDKGAYEVYARTQENLATHPEGLAQTELEWRDVSNVTANGRATIGIINCLNPNAAGWAWSHVGQLDTDGATGDLTVTPRNPKGYKDAWFSLDRILFLPKPAPPGDTPFIVKELDINVAPHGDKTITLQGALGDWPRKRVDIQFYEKASHIYRMLTFTVTKG